MVEADGNQHAQNGSEDSDIDDSLAQVQAEVSPPPTMRSVRDITTDSPSKEIWTRLRYFLDEKYVIDQIAQVQAIDRAAHARNLGKQARQLGYCIRQAEEYFMAASQVDLATRPVLLYYGVISLSQALILLKQNGDYSFDRLRQLNKAPSSWA